MPRTQRPPRIADLIRRLGWAVQYVGPGRCDVPGCCGSPGDGPPFAYTVGLHSHAHPELLIFGLPWDLSLQVLNDVARRVVTGHPLGPDRLLESPNWGFRLAVEDVPNPSEILFSANEHYRLGGRLSVAALQLSYDDVLGRFPWQDGCRTAAVQPRPGTFRA